MNPNTVPLLVAAIVGWGIILGYLVVLAMRSLQTGAIHPLLNGVVSYFAFTGMVLVAILLFFALGTFLGPFGIIVWFALIFAVVEVNRKNRASRQYGLLWLLTVSAERSMPLVPAIEAFAQERFGVFRRRARRLAAMLDDGVPLPNALAACPGLLPHYALPMIRVGHETGTLAASLRRAADAYNMNEPIWMAVHGKITYLLLVPAFGFGIFIFVMLKIVPSFEKIFKDFGQPLPSLTAMLLSVSNLLIDYWFFLLPFVLLGPFLLFYLPIRYFGWIHWDLPGVGRFTSRLDTAQILDTLALVAGRQQAIGDGVASLAKSYPKKKIRQRLKLALADIQMGRDWCESLLWQGLIRRPEAAILQSAQRVGNLAWALREMAESTRRRLVYRLQMMAQLLFPPIIVLMGLGVMFIVVALFIPLISLIAKLSG